jgi:hypothetical protein
VERLRTGRDYRQRERGENDDDRGFESGISEPPPWFYMARTAMRVLMSTLLLAAGLVLVVGLLSTISERSAPHVTPATETPAASIADVRDQATRLIGCIVPLPMLRDEPTQSTEPACAPSAESVSSMELRVTQC